MKKTVIILVLAAFTASGVFAQLSFSFGAGTFFDGSFRNGIKSNDHNFWYEEGKDVISLGAYLFYDASFIEASVNFGYGFVLKYEKDYFGTIYDYNNDSNFNYLMVSLCVIGKFPVNIGDSLFYPAAGVEYNMVLASYENGVKEDWGSLSVSDYLNQYGILAGIGIDFPLSGAMFLRTQGFINIRFPAKYQKDLAIVSNFLNNNSYKTTIGIGPRIKLGFGLKL